MLFSKKQYSNEVLNKIGDAHYKIPHLAMFAGFSLILAMPFYILGRYSLVQNTILTAYSSYWSTQVGALWNVFCLGGLDQRSQLSFSIWEVLNTALPMWFLSALFVWLTYFISAFFMYRLLTLRFGVGRFGGYAGALFMLYNYAEAPPWTMSWTLLLVIIDASFWMYEHHKNVLTYIVAGFLGILYASSSMVIEQPFALFFGFMFILVSKRHILWRIIPQIFVFIIGWLVISIPTFIALQDTVPLALRSQSHEQLRILFFISTTGSHGYRPYVQTALVLLSLYSTRSRNSLAFKVFTYLIFFHAFYSILAIVLNYVGEYSSWFKGIGTGRMCLWTPFLFSFAAGIAVDAIGFSKTNVNKLAKRIFTIAVIAFTIYLLSKQALDTAYRWKTFGSYAYNFDAQVYNKLSILAEKSETFRTAAVRSESGVNDGSLVRGGPIHTNGLETFTGFTHLSTQRQVGYWDSMTKCENRSNIMCLKTFRHPVDYALGLPPFDDGEEIDISAISTTMLKVANVRYLLAQYPVNGDNLIELHCPDNLQLGNLTLKERIRANFSGRDDLYLYEFKDVMPRAYLAHDVRIFDNDTELLSALSEATFNEVRDVVFLSSTDGPVKPPSYNGLSGQASYRKINSDKFEVDISVEGPAYLVISNSYNEGWQCTNQDGKILQMRPAFYLFTAIMVTKEDRTITCHYSPFALL